MRFLRYRKQTKNSWRRQSVVATQIGMLARYQAIVLALLLFCLISYYFILSSWSARTKSVDAEIARSIHRDMVLAQISQQIEQAVPSSSEPHQSYQCKYREYPEPKHHTGLPFLADVFAAENGTAVYFVAVNKGPCMKEWQYAQEFHSYSDRTHTDVHQFICSFPDGSVTFSDPVHRKGFGSDMLWSNAILLIRCRIPNRYISWVNKAALTTNLTVSLHSTEDLEANQENEGATEPKGTYRDIPVCHSSWPMYNNTIDEAAPKQPLPATFVHRYNLSLFTRVKSDYVVNGFQHRSFSISPDMLIGWIEYHHAIGFEHFYIYDSGDTEHGPIEEWLRPYIALGLVTYVWYPFKDCIRDYDADKDRLFGTQGSQYRIGQYAAGNSALRRYAAETKYMAAWDVDEYLVLNPSYTDAKDLINQTIRSEDAALRVREKWISVCQNASIVPGMLPFERARCTKVETKVNTLPKPIMKTDEILYFLVHEVMASTYQAVRNDKRKAFVKPKAQIVTDAYLAHFRRRPYFDYDAENFEGFVSNSSFQMEVSIFDPWVDTIKEKINTTLALSRNEHISTSDYQKWMKPAMPQVTVVIMTYKRLEILLENPILKLIESEPSIRELVVIWNDVTNTTGIRYTEQRMKELGLQSKLRIVVPKMNSMNNRFLMHYVQPKTAGLFFIDDEWAVSQELFRTALAWWRLNPRRAVGFVPRRYDYAPGFKSKYHTLDHGNTTKIITESTGFNILLPGGGLFLHKAYLEKYSANAVGMIHGRNIVDSFMNCDDILLNFVVQSQAHPPLLVFLNHERVKSYTEAETGISSSWAQHLKKRQICIERFRHTLGWSLVTSTHLVQGLPLSTVENY